jgi:hypothetical protein
MIVLHDDVLSFIRGHVIRVNVGDCFDETEIHFIVNPSYLRSVVYISFIQL